MKKIIANALAWLALCWVASAPVYAQQATPNGAPDPAVTAAVRELFDAMHYRALMVSSMQQISQNLGNSMRAGVENAINNNPKLDAATRQQALAKLDASLPALIESRQKLLNDPTLIDEILALVVPLYAREYTLDEIRQIAAFYRTPVGAKMLALAPRLTAEAMQISQQVLARRMPPAVRPPLPGQQQ